MPLGLFWKNCSEIILMDIKKYVNQMLVLTISILDLYF